MNEYIKQAQKFLNRTGVEFKAEFLKNDFHFKADKDKRDIYICTLTRGSRSASFEFGTSIMDSQYYQDKNIKGRTYTLNGGCRTGGYSINDIKKYSSYITLVKGVKPNEYDLLACLQKYDVGTFEDFCNEFGYDEDSITAEKTYKAVIEEYYKVCMIFSDNEMEELHKIQ